MSSEIEVPETPNWLKELEEKREKRLKARLGHEAGAGAPCLKCEDKCPGLDLHFWRKACKICRCPKEEHDVPDDDVYGWAKFQLLGSKPNKIKTKIVLPGRKDEVELDWAPKGQKDTIDKYLKTLPAENLPVKGSQAAQERKQMLQKQIPIHDIDPSLCHELNDEEVKNMEDYIAHIKKNSVGVGQIVSLTDIIKANSNKIKPQEGKILTSQGYDDEKLQDDLSKRLQKVLKDQGNKKQQSGILFTGDNNKWSTDPITATKYKDFVSPLYANTISNTSRINPQYPQGFKPSNLTKKSTVSDLPSANYKIDEKLLQSTNFDPSKIPSQFYTAGLPSINRKLNLNDPPATTTTQYGFENPLFENLPTTSQNSNMPRNITDLICSTYDPTKGTNNNNNNNVNEIINTDPEILKTHQSGKPAESSNRIKKPLSQLQPDQWKNIPEDYLEPHMVNIGPIQDINPIINSATTQRNIDYEDNDFLPTNLDNIKQHLNNLPNCHYCKKSFIKDEFAIIIDRANVLFHADCFRCAGCNQNLADNIYFYHKGTDNIYCGRDYAKIKGYPRCKACDELIFTKEYCLTENTTFHLKHFCCFQCDTPLAGLDYTLEDEKPYCLPCYEASRAARCSTCMRVIKPNEIGCQLNGIHFHADDNCFKCIVCNNPLMQKKFLLRNEKLYCSHQCFNGVC